MFKKLLLTGMVMGFIGSAYAGALVRGVQKLKIVSVSNSAWTAIPSTPDESRIGIIVDIPNGTTDSFLIAMSTYQALDPGVPTSYGLVIDPGNAPFDLPISSRVYLWAICTGQGAKNMTYQEYECPLW